MVGGIANAVPSSSAASTRGGRLPIGENLKGTASTSCRPEPYRYKRSPFRVGGIDATATRWTSEMSPTALDITETHLTGHVPEAAVSDCDDCKVMVQVLQASVARVPEGAAVSAQVISELRLTARPGEVYR